MAGSWPNLHVPWMPLAWSFITPEDRWRLTRILAGSIAPGSCPLTRRPRSERWISIFTWDVTRPLPTYQWLQSVGTNANSIPSPVPTRDLDRNPSLSEFDREMLTYRGKVFVSEIGCGGFNDMDKTAAGFNGQEELA